jgi:hypothetical protein
MLRDYGLGPRDLARLTRGELKAIVDDMTSREQAHG